MVLKPKKQKTIYHIARKREELEQSFSLVYKEYASRGYIPKHYKSAFRLSLYNALPSTTTFVAKQAKEVVATVTLIADSPMGLPMDKIYKKEMDALRKQGRKLAEVSQLSIDSRLFPPGWFSMFNFSKLIFVFRLFKIVFDYAFYTDKLTDFCIAVNPKHQCLYKFLGFKELAGLRYYGSVNRAPAVARRLNLETAEGVVKHRSGLHKVFFGCRTETSAFSNKIKFTASDLEYFFLKKSDIFKKASEIQMEYISSCYPKEKIKALLKKY